jgi:CRISPR system Cascade subunit CasA
MSRFNLIDEKWIPVRFPDGNRTELGILETLLRSREIEAIEDPSPLVTAALLRFLLAVLYRALEGPTDIEQAKALFRKGLPEKRITSYLNHWRDRFWLFDEKYPFGQNPNVPAQKIEPWTKLTAEYNATSNKVLFDHTDTKNPGAKQPRECARWLVSTMSFSIVGGRGYYPSPSPNAMMCVPLGGNLHDTLFFCLVPYPNHEVRNADSAIWERVPELFPLRRSKRPPTGYADVYTWPSRMILLEDAPAGGVARVRFVAGLGFDRTPGGVDPMQPYKADDQRGKLPVQFRADRGTWRDFDSLVPDGGHLAPLTIQNATHLAGNTASKPKSVMVLGLKYQPPNANLDFWRMELFTLPEAMVGDRFIRTEIRRLLDDAEDAHKALWVASSSFARDLLSRGCRMPASEDIKSFVKQMPVNSWYWSTLEARFHEVLRGYILNRDPDDIRLQWLKAARETLASVWEQHRSSVSTGDVWAIRALVKSEGFINRKLNDLNKDIRELES